LNREPEKRDQFLIPGGTDSRGNPLPELHDGLRYLRLSLWDGSMNVEAVARHCGISVETILALTDSRSPDRLERISRLDPAEVQRLAA